MTRPVEWGQVLAFRLQRQHLARAFPADTLEQAAHDGIGLQAQAMPATELAFRARTRGMRAGDLERARLLPARHAERSAMVPKEHSARIYRPAAWVWATVLKGGGAVGVWNSKRADNTFSVEVEEFSPLPRADRKSVEEEIEEMAAFLGLRAELTFAT